MAPRKAGQAFHENGGSTGGAVWKAGESLHEIGRVFGKGHGSIRFLLTQREWMVPAARRRYAAGTLTLAEAGRHLTRNCFRFVHS